MQSNILNYAFSGKNVVINAGREGLEFMFGCGTPLNEPVIYDGPFVATTPEQLAIVRSSFERGEMGKLDLTIPILLNDCHHGLPGLLNSIPASAPSN